MDSEASVGKCKVHPLVYFQMNTVNRLKCQNEANSERIDNHIRKIHFKIIGSTLVPILHNNIYYIDTLLIIRLSTLYTGRTTTTLYKHNVA